MYLPFEWTEVLLVVASVSAFGCLIALIVIIYRLLIDEDSKTETQNSIRFYGIVGCLAFTISPAISVFNIVYGEIYDKETNDILYFMNFISDSAWSIGEICLYLLFIFRIKYIFNDSASRISSITSITFYILLFILYITTTISALIYSSYHLVMYATIIVIITELCHLIIGSMLIYMYISRLIKLFFVRIYSNENQNGFNYYGSNDNDNCDASDLTASFSNGHHDNYSSVSSTSFKSLQIKLLNVMTKLSILSIITIIFSHLFFISMIIYLTSWWYDDDDSAGDRLYFKVLYSIAFIFRWMACLINCICILISFQSAIRWYYCLCRGCDYCCYSICTRYVTKQMGKIKKVKDIKLSLCDMSQHHQQQKDEKKSIGNEI